MNPRSARFARDEFEDGYWREFAGEGAIGRTHDHQFVMLFPTRDDALTMADRLGRQGITTAIDEYAGHEQRPWELTLTARLAPSARALRDFRARLKALAALRGGRLLDEGRPLAAQDAGPAI